MNTYYRAPGSKVVPQLINTGNVQQPAALLYTPPAHLQSQYNKPHYPVVNQTQQPKSHFATGSCCMGRR
jgi:hypothetical protein